MKIFSLLVLFATINFSGFSLGHERGNDTSSGDVHGGIVQFENEGMSGGTRGG